MTEGSAGRARRGALWPLSRCWAADDAPQALASPPTTLVSAPAHLHVALSRRGLSLCPSLQGHVRGAPIQRPLVLLRFRLFPETLFTGTRGRMGM